MKPSCWRVRRRRSGVRESYRLAAAARQFRVSALDEVLHRLDHGDRLRDRLEPRQPRRRELLVDLVARHESRLDDEIADVAMRQERRLREGGGCRVRVVLPALRQR